LKRLLNTRQITLCSLDDKQEKFPERFHETHLIATMKFSLSTLLALSALTSAAPSNELIRRQGKTSNELEDSSGCKPVSLIMARGSTEGGNMGTIVGGPLCKAMKDMSNDQVACQGIGGAYKATLAANTQPKGTDAQSIAEAKSVIETAMTNCPKARVVMAGYSQGSAVISQAVQMMAPADKAKVDAVVFYGYTKNKQANGMLPGYPDQQLKVFCRQDDGVCGGKLQVTAGHLAYQDDGTVEQGAAFLMSMVGKNAKPSGATSPPAATSAAAAKGKSNKKLFS
jgi:cutinase